jgi:hypothetical protein
MRQSDLIIFRPFFARWRSDYICSAVGSCSCGRDISRREAGDIKLWLKNQKSYPHRSLMHINTNSRALLQDTANKWNSSTVLYSESRAASASDLTLLLSNIQLDEILSALPANSWSLDVDFRWVWATYDVRGTKEYYRTSGKRHLGHN